MHLAYCLLKVLPTAYLLCYLLCYPQYNLRSAWQVLSQSKTPLATCYSLLLLTKGALPVQDTIHCWVDVRSRGETPFASAGAATGYRLQDTYSM